MGEMADLEIDRILDFDDGYCNEVVYGGRSMSAKEYYDKMELIEKTFQKLPLAEVIKRSRRLNNE